MQRITANQRRGSLLVIEDNADHWQLIHAGLKRNLPETNIVWVNNESGAQEYVDNCTTNEQLIPKMVLLDLYLPNPEQGWNLLHTLKNKTSPLHQVPVVVFSHSNRIEDITTSYKAGGSSYLVKPTDRHEWQIYFDTLCQYWWNIVTLPNKRV